MFGSFKKELFTLMKTEIELKLKSGVDHQNGVPNTLPDLPPLAVEISPEDSCLVRETQLGKHEFTDAARLDIKLFVN